MFVRQPGRQPLGRDAGSTSELRPPPNPPRGWQLDPPEECDELIGWCCQALFPTGAKREMRWHEGCVVEWKQAMGSRKSYRLFFPVDCEDEWVEVPDPGVCFRCAHFDSVRVSTRELDRAKRSLSEQLD